MARTLVDIDDELLGEAMRATGQRTKRGAITVALEEVVRKMRDEELVRQLKDGMLEDLSDPEVIRSAQR